MSTKKLLMTAGAAAMILMGGSGTEASERWRSLSVGAVAHAQAAASNVARTSQRGNRNAAAIRQDGSGNVARTIQRGNDNQAEIGQTGDNNRGRIIQVGDGHNAVLQQEGGQRSNIIQVNKGNASVNIQTGQGRRKPSVSVAGRPKLGQHLRKLK